MKIKIIGVHKIEADEPCHLLELEINNPTVSFDIGSITQEISDEPIENWQVPFGEHYLDHIWTMPFKNGTTAFTHWVKI